MIAEDNHVQPPSVKIAVVSDLHVYTSAEPGKAPSFLKTEEAVANPLQSPLNSLDILIAEKKMTADFLFCPGDLCDRADGQALRFAWRKLSELGQHLKADVVATTGNHDIDSRHSSELEAANSVKQLSNYPIGDSTLANEYWAKHFTVLEYAKTDCRIAILNSSACHGQIDIEKNHGRIQETTLRQLERKLTEASAPAANILLCHHNPQQQSELLLGEDDWMRSGQPLLDLLSTPELGSWMVVHGHKHHPKLTYAAGGGTSPVVLSCGSFAAHLFPQLSSRTKNQFHLIEVNIPRSRTHGISGQIQS